MEIVSSFPCPAEHAANSASSRYPSSCSCGASHPTSMRAAHHLEVTEDTEPRNVRSFVVVGLTCGAGASRHVRGLERGDVPPALPRAQTVDALQQTTHDGAESWSPRDTEAKLAGV